MAPKRLFFSLLFLPVLLFSLEPEEEGPSLFSDLALVQEIDKEINDRLPFFYNASMMGGYFNTPSARMEKAGMLGIGAASVPPYAVYGVNFQMFDHLELSGNYRVYNDLLDTAMGAEGFGNVAERIGNIKVGLLIPGDTYGNLPSFAVGAEDFFGTKGFNAQYAVLTQQWVPYNFEITLGWGHGRIKGLFGGAAWTPFRQTALPILNGISLIAEYDANDYKKSPKEHPKGREVRSRINGGISFVGWDVFQISVFSVRGEKVGGSASIRYPLGTSKGFLPKVKDPIPYIAPIDTEPLGMIRPEKDFSQEFTYAFSDQGLDIYTIYLTFDEKGNQELWIRLVNNRYRQESVVRDRIQHVLAALTPSNIATVVVVVESVALPSHEYRFRVQDLTLYRLGTIGAFEMETLSPMEEVRSAPSPEISSLLFHRTKEIWTFTARPRLLTFFGSSKGKFKYNFGLIASPEGYFFDDIYYKMQVGYSIKSTMWDISDVDRFSPSQLPAVRTDTIRYFQNNTFSLEQAYLQKSWNFGKGVTYRLAVGDFEPAYGGGATELLYYPVDSCWAIGGEFATLLKRHYHGVKFTTKIRRLEGTTPTYEHFIGIQYFLDLYYYFEPLKIRFKAMVGQFLAKDKGVRFEAGRLFESGLRVSLWYTITNAHDKMHGNTYYDKGVSFAIPLDMFLRQSSRNFLGYAMDAWLRDCGAIGETGKPLYNILFEERYD